LLFSGVAVADATGMEVAVDTRVTVKIWLTPELELVCDDVCEEVVAAWLAELVDGLAPSAKSVPQLGEKVDDVWLQQFPS